ncbi:MAG: D-hexose-6-phosphate mutarotase [bacterium]
MVRCEGSLSADEETRVLRTAIPNTIELRSADGSRAEVHIRGAHVSSWRPAPDEDERLFLSARAESSDAVALRGGIPVIFPQFAAEGPLPRHGFARTSLWQFVGEHREANGAAAASFTLSDSAATRAIWPVAFHATLTVRVGGAQLSVQLVVENTDDKAFHFTTALHTYLRVHNVADAELSGLKGTHYRESGAPGVLIADDAEAIHVVGEVDRVYVSAPRRLILRERARSLVIDKDGFPDVVIWNPGARAAAAMTDMEPGGERKMLCVEAAAVQRHISLGAGERWSGTQILAVET